MESSDDYVLVVEDDDELRETLVDFLYEEGYASCSAPNGEEALAFLETAPRPCLVLLDQSMPGMTGEELLRVMRAAPDLAAVPVCVVTGDPRLAPDGAAAVIKKPIDVSNLLNVLNRHCRGRAGCTSPARL
jgi:CheY-like chemotaxis protein